MIMKQSKPYPRLALAVFIGSVILWGLLLFYYFQFGSVYTDKIHALPEMSRERLERFAHSEFDIVGGMFGIICGLNLLVSTLALLHWRCFRKN